MTVRATDENKSLVISIGLLLIFILTTYLFFYSLEQNDNFRKRNYLKFHDMLGDPFEDLVIWQSYALYYFEHYLVKDMKFKEVNRIVRGYDYIDEYHDHIDYYFKYMGSVFELKFQPEKDGSLRYDNFFFYEYHPDVLNYYLYPAKFNRFTVWFLFFTSLIILPIWIIYSLINYRKILEAIRKGSCKGGRLLLLFVLLFILFSILWNILNTYPKFYKRQLNSKNILIKIKAIDRLALENKDQAIEVLPRLLKDNEQLIQMKAGLLLAKLKDRSAVPALIEALQNKSNEAPWWAAYALGRLGDPSAVDPLIKSLEHKDWRVRWRSAEALGFLKDNKAVSPLMTGFEKEDDWYVRTAIVSALGNLGDKRAVPLLIKALKDEDLGVRWRAAEALGKIGDPSAIPALKDARSDIGEKVRKEAEKAIDMLKNKNLK